MMVIAGAGSGKTRVLTYRIANLIENGVDPFSILALTFTNKAAREMKERIGKIVGDHESKNIWMGTFHSVFARILRIEYARINYPREFTIYDAADSKSLLKTIIKDLGLDEKIYKPATVFTRISGAKNNLISWQEYSEDVDIQAEDRSSGRPRTAEIYQAYATRCFRAGAMDFDDILFNMNVLLRDHNDLLHKYQHRFNFILVDEYQDTNFAQYLIIKKLGAVHENVCVVGDDAQSIYAFRGANIQNILNFKVDYPDFSLYKLEQNYRSTKVIVNAANSVIEKNKDQIEKTVWTANPEGERILVHKAASDNDEGYFTAQQIFELKNRHQSFNKDFAILYRTNAQSRSFEEALRKLNIPYRIYGGLSFYQRKEIKDLISYFRLTANPKDEEALRRVINYPARGIGKTTLDKMTVAADEHGVSMWDLLEYPSQYPFGLGGASLTKVKDFTMMIKGFRAMLDKKSAYDLGQHIANTAGILSDLYSDRSPEGVARYENIQELLNGMKEFSEPDPDEEAGQMKTLSDFLIDIALLTDTEQDDGDDDKVSLMTIHSAKGLEFPYVFIVGLEENLFPSQMALNSREDLEEERRLFYVALTRARTRAILSYATTRYRWGQLVFGDPSRFISEVDPSFLDRMDLINMGQGKSRTFGGFGSDRQSFFKREISTPAPLGKVPVKAGSSTGDEDYKQITAGMEVIHERFGKGKVLVIDGDDENLKATVFFPSHGQKQLLLRFAKLKVV
jgi:DNA helicase-2/ATP-dependent DNA helicase PcrA